MQLGRNLPIRELNLSKVSVCKNVITFPSHLSSGAYSLIGNFVGASASICAVFATQNLIKNQDHQQWLLERKQEETRELLSALSGAYVELLRLRPFTALKPEDQLEIDQAKAYSLRILSDRIYIDDCLNLRELAEQWRVAMEDYEANLNEPPLTKAYDSISKRVREALLRT